MKVAIRLIVLLSGVCFPSQCAAPQRGFVLFSTPKSWYEGQRQCREVGCDLATVHDMEEMQMLLNLTDNRYQQAVWLGLHKAQSDAWHWSLADEDLYGAGERTYAQITDNGNNCGLYQGGKVTSYSCRTYKKSICFDAKKQGPQQYVLTSNNLYWRDARDYCRRHYTDLASVRNATENSMVQEASQGLAVYVGAFRDPWEWSDGSYSSMRHWKAGQVVYPSFQEGGCVAMVKSQAGKWGQWPCGEALPFLCSCPLKRVIIKVGIGSKEPGLDLKDAAVQAHLLNHIRSQLTQTVATDFQLQWAAHPHREVWPKKK